MRLESRHDGTLVFGYLDTDSPDRFRASDTVLVKAATPYAAEMRPERFGALNTCDISGEHGVQVSPHATAAARDGAQLLGLLLSGDGTLEQDGRRCPLSPGEFALYSAERPFRLDLGGNYRWFVLHLDYGTAKLMRLAQDATANQELPRSPSGRILASMLTELAYRARDLGPVSRSEMGEHVAGVIRTLVRESGRRRSPADQAHVLDRILDHIDRHLADRLAPAEIASANHVSVRSLHALFQRQGETVGDHIRRRRLDRIRRDLTDPALDHLPAYAVAARWGIQGPSHFSKLFKAEFGLSPREFRDRFRLSVTRG
ncbi:helix-turn-helix domain-containing protein [Nonomuraea sp. NPDC046570]|uniref:helix-turn-helix domain-containing protein n=1 Tax=Nonomuraea sp. NPDC046570 TaxID=3155255 RepID=UPI0033E4B7AA